MTREEEIRARLENIVPGGWARATPMVEGYPTEIWHAIDNTTICRLAKTEDEYANSDFIYMAPEDISYLLKENQKLRDAVEVLRDNMVQALAYTAQCPECELLLPSHTEYCELQQAMKRESQ